MQQNIARARASLAAPDGALVLPPPGRNSNGNSSVSTPLKTSAEDAAMQVVMTGELGFHGDVFVALILVVVLEAFLVSCCSSHWGGAGTL